MACVGALVVSAIALEAPLLNAPGRAEAAAPFDASAWAPWWQATNALNNFNAHAGEFGELSPFFFTATSAGTIVNSSTSVQVAAYKSAALAAGKPLVPTIVDGTPARTMASILSYTVSRNAHVNAIVSFVVNGGYAGIDLDYEKFAFSDGSSTWATTKPAWATFIVQLATALHSAGKTLAVSVPPVGTSESNYWVYDYPTLGANVDRIRIMTYAYSTSSPGPIAPIDWVRRAIDAAKLVAPASKVVMGIPVYGTDWVTGIDGSCPVTIPVGMSLTTRSPKTSEFPALAKRKGVIPSWDPVSKERTFTYVDSIGGLNSDGFPVRCNVSHLAYYMDPDGVFERVALAKAKGIAGTALWALGNDDADTWHAIDAAMLLQPNPGYTQLTPDVVPPPAPPMSAPLPGRYVDTRSGMKTIDAQFAGAGERPANSTLVVQIAGRGAVPADASAIALNVTAIGIGQGYITVYPCGTKPATSNLNVSAGKVISNSVITRLSDAGTICIYNQSATHLIVDVSAVLSADAFVPVATPARLLDTRPYPTVDSQMSGIGAMKAGDILTVQVAGRGGMSPTARTAVLNVTVDGATASGWLTVWPCDGPPPPTSNLNYVRGSTLPNAVVTALSATGTVCVYAAGGGTQVIIDAFGELSLSRYSPLAQPARLLDTRPGLATVDGQFAGGGTRSVNSVLTLQVGSRAGLGAPPVAVVLNVTVDQPATSGFVTVYPCSSAPPTVSNVNFAAGQTLPNLVVTAVAADGTVCLLASTRLHLVVDVFGSLNP
ncbi:unannotated protein [freshwater metagenome]|uniref:Unannotated protein n=1 Tax=freshwater metagenome TaxID=449393 RepID=A0A6J7CQE5_9ZZZZ